MRVVFNQTVGRAATVTCPGPSHSPMLPGSSSHTACRSRSHLRSVSKWQHYHQQTQSPPSSWLVDFRQGSDIPMAALMPAFMIQHAEDLLEAGEGHVHPMGLLLLPVVDGHPPNLIMGHNLVDETDIQDRVLPGLHFFLIIHVTVDRPKLNQALLSSK